MSNQTNNQAMMMELELTPSSFEKNTFAVKDEDSTGEKAEKRPKGNIFGNVMHRSFELLVDELRTNITGKVSEDEIKRIIQIAVMESASDIEEKYRNDGGFDKNAKEFEEYLVPKLVGFARDDRIKDLFIKAGAKENIHPEYSFSFTTNFAEFEKDIPEIAKELKRDHSNISDETKVWVHGISDLVLEHPGSGEVIVIDYKSDIKQPNESVKVFEQRLFSKYSGQLSFYEYAMKKAFGDVTIKTGLYHMYL